MIIKLDGVKALVTGASSGIGREIATELAGSGARVAVHFNRGRDEAERLAGTIGNGSRAFGADLADPARASALFEEAAGAFGGLDLLVNNAGIFEPAPVTMDKGEWLDMWQRTISVNLTSTGILCREAIDLFMKSGGGRIVNIASRAAFRGETKEYLPYAASKGGMVSLSRSIARSFGKENIKSFVIAPGFVRTPMCDGVIDEAEVINGELALGEMTTPQHIAPLVVFIASGRLDHATGTS
ncbi:MAG TPA: SDR family NAD(P)-dependent oxidoreductase, partial [Candidatus Krumholzibacterium sp.]|nr:SDR family NAD(P)-dependent oxidoreductase [Candidatus Krumholzibacterium sp.]